MLVHREKQILDNGKSQADLFSNRAKCALFGFRNLLKFMIFF